MFIKPNKLEITKNIVHDLGINSRIESTPSVIITYTIGFVYPKKGNILLKFNISFPRNSDGFIMAGFEFTKNCDFELTNHQSGDQGSLLSYVQDAFYEIEAILLAEIPIGMIDTKVGLSFYTDLTTPVVSMFSEINTQGGYSEGKTEQT